MPKIMERYAKFVEEIIEKIQKNFISKPELDRYIKINFGSDPRTVKNHRNNLYDLGFCRIKSGETAFVELISDPQEDLKRRLKEIEKIVPEEAEAILKAKPKESSI